MVSIFSVLHKTHYQTQSLPCFLCFLQKLHIFFFAFFLCFNDSILASFSGCPIVSLLKTLFVFQLIPHICHKSFDSICVAIFLGSVFCSKNLYICFFTKTVLCLVLQLYSKTLKQGRNIAIVFHYVWLIQDICCSIVFQNQFANMHIITIHKQLLL